MSGDIQKITDRLLGVARIDDTYDDATGESAIRLTAPDGITEYPYVNSSERRSQWSNAWFATQRFKCRVIDTVDL